MLFSVNAQIVLKMTSDLGITPGVGRRPPFLLCLFLCWDVKEKNQNNPLHPWLNQASHSPHSSFHWWLTYFWKGRTECADITCHSKHYRIFAPLFLSQGYGCEIFFKVLCLIKCCSLSPDSVTLNYLGRLQSVSFLSSKKSLKII